MNRITASADLPDSTSETYSDDLSSALNPFLSGNYDQSRPVGYERWQSELNFDNLQGEGRSNAAANEQKWYDNYRLAWLKADNVTRFMIDQQHGFYGGSLVNSAPSGGGGGGGGGGSVPTSAPISEIDDAAEAPREEISPPPGNVDEGRAGGLEDTVNTTESDTGRTAFDQDAVDRVALDDVEEGQNTNNIAPAAPSEQVRDPATGTIYANPAAARAAGITNYEYVVDGA